MKERMLMVLGEHRSWQERENRFFACCSCSFRLPGSTTNESENVVRLRAALKLCYTFICSYIYFYT